MFSFFNEKRVETGGETTRPAKALIATARVELRENKKQRKEKIQTYRLVNLKKLPKSKSYSVLELIGRENKSSKT